MINKAKKFAFHKHKKQIRKGDGKPYFTHLSAVYEIAKTITSDEATLSACWLHDTIEDTPTTFKDLVKEFGLEVAQIVQAVSEDKDLAWEEAKEKYLQTVFVNSKAIVVAWADKMHNTQDLANVTDHSVFNRSIRQKLDFYSKFAQMIEDNDMREQLQTTLDNIYDIVYYIDE